jgi:hypothetical protein
MWARGSLQPKTGSLHKKKNKQTKGSRYWGLYMKSRLSLLLLQRLEINTVIGTKGMHGLSEFFLPRYEDNTPIAFIELV